MLIFSAWARIFSDCSCCGLFKVRSRGLPDDHVGPVRVVEIEGKCMFGLCVYVCVCVIAQKVLGAGSGTDLNICKDAKKCQEPSQKSSKLTCSIFDYCHPRYGGGDALVSSGMRATCFTTNVKAIKNGTRDDGGPADYFV